MEICGSALSRVVITSCKEGRIILYVGCYGGVINGGRKRALVIRSYNAVAVYII